MDQQQRLLAGRQREQALAAPVVVEVVELPLVVEQRAEGAGAVQQDHPLPQGGGIRARGGHRGVDHDAHPGRLVAFERAHTVLLARRVALRNHRSPRADRGGVEASARRGHPGRAEGSPWRGGSAIGSTLLGQELRKRALAEVARQGAQGVLERGGNAPESRSGEGARRPPPALRAPRPSPSVDGSPTRLETPVLSGEHARDPRDRLLDVLARVERGEAEVALARGAEAAPGVRRRAPAPSRRSKNSHDSRGRPACAARRRARARRRST